MTNGDTYHIAENFVINLAGNSNRKNLVSVKIFNFIAYIFLKTF